MSMPRRSKAEVEEAQAELVKHKDDVIKAYYDGATKAGICRTWAVDDRFLKLQFELWGVEERSQSEVNKLSAPRGPRYPKRRASRSLS
ncbi:hypothetical protein JHN55_22795 [Streptomyces sp. MBT56]|uniref:hypothetical protein n=1 Tax=unclassified Streptomyces TaxID=2593676 RepID=UPI00190B4C6C|nr:MULTISPECIES: hypothetical protein [unclassified Streptomyces]MBK3559300.1 hypothetical protein [Streptomyces sp. MBT56]MBK3601023.1 hypothetical protein [Streptomyces sp. MBT54]MBK3613929.1 hypothetical protein [Streptomyces sp. MBT98]MBK6042006.1 hypothetical protein [Streptomyces sp. MBT55]